MAQQQNSSSKAQKTGTYLITITGIVQGVGFRPFVWLAAEKLKLYGNAANTTGGVILKVNAGDEGTVLKFMEYIQKNKPAAALIENIKYNQIPFEEFSGFNIEKSYRTKKDFTLVSPDIATCDKCIEDIRNNNNKRRFNYPFTNCTNCGPRFTIIEKMPYDRPNTSMKKFIQCPECSAEYNDPRDRRFHAQPNACSICGPMLKLLNSKGKVLKIADPVAYAAKLLRQGFIVGIKSLGGFQIACDATNDYAVAKLRKRKARPAKPFALMFKDTASISWLYDLSKMEQESLNSTTAPIVLVRKKALAHDGPIDINPLKNPSDQKMFKAQEYPVRKAAAAVNISGKIPPGISSGISFANKYEGVMLPYTPLHHLLFQQIDVPLVMTSGNISEEPIAYKNSQAVIRLGNICDYFLIHDRDIFSRYDDSVIKVFDDKEMIIRRARGYAPYPVKTDTDIGNSVILAVGAQEKNTFCLQTGNYALVSQHIGDLETSVSYDFFRQTLKNYKKIFGIKKIDIVISDKHPDYISTKFAKEHFKSAKKIQIQHHEAHIASVIAENKLLEALDNEMILGFAWDGTGYGDDDKIWGSEIFTVDRFFNFNRIGSLSEKYMPGGEITIKKPYRMALTYLYDIWKENISKKIPAAKNPGVKVSAGTTAATAATGVAGIISYSGFAATGAADGIKDIKFVDYIFKNFPFYKDISSVKEIAILKSQVETGFNSPKTTSMGRFFDAVSSILNITHIASYEGEAAIELEMAADLQCDLEYDLQYLSKPGFYDNGPFVLDDYHIFRQILDDLENNIKPPVISAKFHNSLVRAIVLISLRAQKKYNIKKIALSGGVFQNNLLLAKSFTLLKKHGFEPYSNFKVPVNDGGISLGQAYYGAWKINQNDKNK